MTIKPFAFSEVLELLEIQRSLVTQNAWKLYEEALHGEEGRQLNKADFWKELDNPGTLPHDIKILKNYCHEPTH